MHRDCGQFLRARTCSAILRLVPIDRRPDDPFLRPDTGKRDRKMPIDLTCSCGRQLRVADEFAGRQGRCPACGAVLEIPQRETFVSRPASPPLDEAQALTDTPGLVGPAQSDFQDSFAKSKVPVSSSACVWVSVGRPARNVPGPWRKRGTPAASRARGGEFALLPPLDSG